MGRQVHLMLDFSSCGVEGVASWSSDCLAKEKYLRNDQLLAPECILTENSAAEKSSQLGLPAQELV
jgi:hypothetical protein